MAWRGADADVDTLRTWEWIAVVADAEAQPYIVTGAGIVRCRTGWKPMPPESVFTRSSPLHHELLRPDAAHAMTERAPGKNGGQEAQRAWEFFRFLMIHLVGSE